MRVADYSFGRPNPQSLIDAGYTGVVRYLAYLGGPSGPKVLTLQELQLLHSVNLAVGLVWEQTADPQSWDALEADRQADALGFPKDIPIYFAVDEDVPDSHYQTVSDHLASLPLSRPKGIYGGAGLVQFCLANSSAQYGWIASATSWGHHEAAPDAALIQWVNKVIPDADDNTVLKPDWGGWLPGSPSHPTIQGEDDMPPKLCQLTDNGDLCVIPGNGMRPWLAPAADINLIHAFIFGAFDPAPLPFPDPVPQVSDPAQIAAIREWAATATVNASGAPTHFVGQATVDMHAA